MRVLTRFPPRMPVKRRYAVARQRLLLCVARLSLKAHDADIQLRSLIHDFGALSATPERSTGGAG